jgi:hypothetical protein
LRKGAGAAVITGARRAKLGIGEPPARGISLPVSPLEDEPGSRIGGQAAHQSRGAADCGEYREATGVSEDLESLEQNARFPGSQGTSCSRRNLPLATGLAWASRPFAAAKNIRGINMIKKSIFTLKSTTFADGKLMPKKVSNTKANGNNNPNCVGDNVSPQFSWSNVPDGRFFDDRP